MTRTALLALGAVFSMTHLAHADCEARAKIVRAQAEQMQDGRRKTLVDYDLKRVEKEIGEADEEECTEALDHATKLLTQR